MIYVLTGTERKKLKDICTKKKIISVPLQRKLIRNEINLSTYQYYIHHHLNNSHAKKDLQLCVWKLLDLNNVSRCHYFSHFL